ncbi:MAG: methyltransferase domain-containing protein [Bacteroidetes bacterium]|nr:methyltransferase domain-containing protein [Bacteroidota bacterium]
MEILKTCPICNSAEYTEFLTCTDYTQSKKEFTIVQCKSCGFKFTNPRPDTTEIGSYYKSEEYISHSDTTKGLINRLYHLVRKYTLAKKLQLVVRLCGSPSAKDQKSLLDIGCGTGAFLKICNDAGFKCIGIEPDVDARKLAINNYKLDVRSESELNTLQIESFDIITMWHVLEHVHDLNGRIIKIKDLLKPGGWAIIAVPNCNSLDAKHYGKEWAAYDVPRHLYHFTPKDINELFKKYGMKVIETFPMRFDSFYVSMLSEKYKTGAVNYLRAICQGALSNISAIRSGHEFSSQIYIIRK